MTDGPKGDDFLDELFTKITKTPKGQKLAESSPSQSTETWDPELIPESQHSRSREDDEIDAVLKRVGILDAYNRWCGKMRPSKRGGQHESIMISCPNPAHPDKDPSAWANDETNLWYCRPCEMGGDIFDIAAWHFGYPVPGYKVGKSFHDLKRDMAKSMGYQIQRSANPAIPESVYLPVGVPDPLPPPPTPTPEPIATVTPIRAIQEVVSPQEAEDEANDEHLEFDIIFPTLAWREIVTADTFLAEYMQACTIDDAAEEYHFWNGMLAIGLAVGKDVTLQDFIPVYANLLVCALGRTGDRKTRAMSQLVNLMKEALPYDYKTGMSSGVKLIQSVASGEQLIAEYDQKVPDPTNPKVMLQGMPVRGLTMYAEMSGLIGRATRLGSVIKDTIMYFADVQQEISTSSRTGGQIRAVEPFFCMATTTQPESLKDLLKEGDATSGFLNRWIFASGKPKTRVAIGGATVDLTDCVMPLKRIHAQLKREIEWSEAAHKRFTEHFHQHISPAQHDNPILGRLDLLEKKLILLLCINENLNEVPEYIVDRVISMHGYLLSSYGITTTSMAYESENNKIFNDIVRQIIRLSEKDVYGPSAKNIRDRLSSKKYDRLKMDRIFESIQKEALTGGRIEINQGDVNKPGRKTDHYKWTG